MRILQNIVSWRTRKEFRRQVARLVSGMSTDDVRQLLGQPHQVDEYNDEEDFDSIWRYNRAIAEHTDFCLAVKGNVFSHAWSAQSQRK